MFPSLFLWFSNTYCYFKLCERGHVNDTHGFLTVLTYMILNEANKLIAAGVNPMELRRGIEKRE